MRVDKLKEHIHRELFGERFPEMQKITEQKERFKRETMIRSVKIMFRHEQTEEDAIKMLECKFFLTKDEAVQLIRDIKNSDNDNEKEEDE